MAQITLTVRITLLVGVHHLVEAPALLELGMARDEIKDSVRHTGEELATFRTTS